MRRNHGGAWPARDHVGAEAPVSWGEPEMQCRRRDWHASRFAVPDRSETRLVRRRNAARGDMVMVAAKPPNRVTRRRLLVVGCRRRWVHPTRNVVEQPMERQTDGNGTKHRRRAADNCAEREHRPNRRERVQLAIALNAKGRPTWMQSAVKRAAVRRAMEGVGAANRKVARVPDVREVVIAVDQDPPDEKPDDGRNRPPSRAQRHGECGGRKGMMWWKHVVRVASPLADTMGR